VAQNARKNLDAKDSEWAVNLGLNIDLDKDSSSESSESESEDEGTARRPVTSSLASTTTPAANGFEEVPTSGPTKAALDAAGLAIASQMVSAKRKREIIEQAYNRYAQDDARLPNWFADEEHKHKQIGVQMTKEMAADIKEREKRINERPIKKVLEAKARKKKKTVRTMAKANQQVETIAENNTLSGKGPVPPAANRCEWGGWVKTRRVGGLP